MPVHRISRFTASFHRCDCIFYIMCGVAHTHSHTVSQQQKHESILAENLSHRFKRTFNQWFSMFSTYSEWASSRPTSIMPNECGFHTVETFEQMRLFASATKNKFHGIVMVCICECDICIHNWHARTMCICICILVALQHSPRAGSRMISKTWRQRQHLFCLLPQLDFFKFSRDFQLEMARP